VAPDIAARLGFAPGTEAHRYVTELAEVTPETTPLGRLEPLDAGTVAEVCARLELSAADTTDARATFPSPDASPEWWWCLERAAARLVRDMGDYDAERGTWPQFWPGPYPPEARCHLLHLALVVAPRTVAFLTSRGLTEDLAWAALRDVGRHAAIFRRVHGTVGMDAAWWVTLCLRGELLELGRLQYNHVTIGGTDESPPWYGVSEAAARGEGFRFGDECLGVHIPEGTPLDPGLVDESFEMASDIFPKVFPSPRRRVATCRSWLLDPQLARYLPPDSRIVDFQRRFELVPRGEPGDRDVLEFVFRAPLGTDLESLPRRTTMERAAVAHLLAGGHWERRTGWVALPGQEVRATQET
jgi:hypothetical protein